MLIFRKAYTLLWLALVMNCCVEPFDFMAMDFDKVVVVDGRLTDEEQTHYINLSFTRPVGEEDAASPITGAQVWVEDSEGVRTEFTETQPGRYESGPEVAGIPGRGYQLFFTTGEGTRYQSEPQELLASPPIDSIYDEYLERVNTNTDELNKGIQFFIDTHDESSKAQFYKYEWEETYEVRAQYPSQYEFFSDPDTAIFRNEPIYICYASSKSSGIILGSTANLKENRLSNVGVRYITNETDQLRYAYSILVKQHVISPVAYTFYRKIIENNQNTGSLFDQQLGAVIGNVTSVDDPDEIVLGFFEVSGVSKKRAFFKVDDLDNRFPWPQPLYPCNSDQIVTTGTPDSLEYYVRGLGLEITVALYGENSFSADLAPKYCADCRYRGPTKQPDFWIY